MEDSKNFIAFQKGQEETPIRTEEEKERMRGHQMGKEGVSYGYNDYFSISRWCKAILGDKDEAYLIEEKDIKGEKKGTFEFTRKYILGTLKNYISYTEYISEKTSPDYSTFLTTKGKEIVKKLDKIALEVKEITKQNILEMDIKRLEELFTEGRNLIESQDK
ncbi:MAG: hypothetical protein WC822_03955 [Candidatus Paceibacterota bacterium]|jgi:hypothetical protein